MKELAEALIAKTLEDKSDGGVDVGGEAFSDAFDEFAEATGLDPGKRGPAMESFRNMIDIALSRERDDRN